MSDSTENTTGRERIRSALITIGSEASCYSYPLFAADEYDRPELYGTSVLMAVDGLPILVTAAHVIYEITRSGSAIHIGARRVVELPLPFVLSSPDGNDPLDLAAMVVPPDLVNELRAPLPPGRTTVGSELSNVQLRCIHGFPISKNKTQSRVNKATRVFKAQGFTYAGASRQLQNDYPEYDKKAELHIALRYQSQGINEKGEKVTPPHPAGISGGGLWAVAEALTPGPAMLEGIAIEFYKDQSLVFATRIEHVLSFIRRHLLAGGYERE